MLTTAVRSARALLRYRTSPLQKATPLPRICLQSLAPRLMMPYLCLGYSSSSPSSCQPEHYRRSPFAMAQDPFVALPRRRSLANAKRQKRFSVSVMEELQHVLGTEVDLESAMEDSPHLPYDVNQTTPSLCGSPGFEMDSILVTPPMSRFGRSSHPQ
jgi:hypothetical protein